MKAIWLAAVLLSLSEYLHARLGETQEQCEKRYGEFTKMTRPYPGKDIFKTRIDNKEGTMAIILWFIDGKCESIEYACAGKWEDGELDNLYKKNFGDKKYKTVFKFTRLVEDGGMMVPKGDDGLIYRNTTGEDLVVFSSKKFLDMESKAREVDKEKPLSRIDGL